MFRRRSKDSSQAQEPDATGVTDADESTGAGDDAAQPDEAAGVELPPRPGGTKGPYDVADAPDDDVHRMDFGSLRVPVLDGMEVRFDLDEAGQITGFVLADGESLLQLAAFAAPKRSGLWEEVRAEIAESVQQGGGETAEVLGPFGTELHARIPSGGPGEHAPARFIGVDASRWFLRGLLSGPAAIDPPSAERLLVVLGETVVNRGSDAMPLKEMLPIAMPAEVAAAAQQAQEEALQQAQQQGRGILPEEIGPGPTITETR